MAKLIRFDGQSIGEALFTRSSGTLTADAETHVLNSAGTGWVPPYGDGAITYSKCLREALQEPIYLINACVGGSALLNYGPTGATNCWSAPTGALVGAAIAKTNAALGLVPGLQLDRVEAVRGQTESYTGGYYNMPAAYLAGEQAVLATLRAAHGADFRYCVWPVGKVHAGSTANVLLAQGWFYYDPDAPADGIEPGPAMYDRALAPDNLHLANAAEDMWMGIRAARNAKSYFDAKAAGEANLPHCGAGPVIESLTRHPNNSTYTMLVNIKVKGGLCCVPTGQWPNQDTTWLNGFSANAPLTGAQLMGGKVKLYSSVQLSGPITVSYQGERDCSSANVVYDTNQQWGDQGQPMLPLALSGLTSG